MDLGELNTFINPNFDLLILPDSHRIPEKTPFRIRSSYWVLNFHKKNLHLFKTPRVFIHQRFISTIISWNSSILPSMFCCCSLNIDSKAWLFCCSLNTPKRHAASYSPFQPLEGPIARWSLGFPFFFQSESARSQACNLVFWSWPKESMMQTIRSKDRIWDSVFQIPQGEVVRKSEMGVKGGDGSAVLATGDSYKVAPLHLAYIIV